jgi:hypothetical protein
MNAQRFQQVRTDVRRTIGRHTLALSLGLSLLIVALVAQRYTAPHAGFIPASSRTNSAPLASQSWPGATITGSAYDGQSARAAHITAPVVQGWPGATLTGSAYDGQSGHSIRPAVVASNWPGATLIGSAYNGQSVRTADITVPMAQKWPGATLTGSAYNGQSARPMNLATPSSYWPGANLTGSAYNGQ